MLSRIIPLSLQKIILLCFPMISTIMVLRHKSPSSSRCSISKWMILSSDGCVIATILPFPIYLRRSIQKFGAVIGLGLFSSVRYMSGREALAEMQRRFCPEGVLIVSSSSSVSGCAILLIRPFKIVWFSS